MATAGAEVVTYGPPRGAALKTSDEFSLEVNGKKVWVEKMVILKQDVKRYYYPQDPNSHVNIANFSASGKLRVALRLLKTPIKSVIIRPKSLGIQSKLDGDLLTFEVKAPQKLVVEVNEPGGYCLNIFANPLEKNPPRKGDPNVTYYGPGTHHTGEVKLKSDHTYYIAGGAIVFGRFHGDNVHDVRILGRGIIDGHSFEDRFNNCITLNNCSNVIVKGVITRNGLTWQNHINYCRDVVYDNVKAIDWSRYGDGINPTGSNNVLINDCYIQVSDDCIAIKTNLYHKPLKKNVDSITVTNCIMNVMKPDGVGDGVTVGFEDEADSMTNILVRNCDILHTRGGGGTGGHSAFSIPVWGKAWVKNVRFEDIRVEEQMAEKNLELYIHPTDMYGGSGPGHIKGVYMKNVCWENAEKPFILKGHSKNNLVEDVTFDNCYVGGKLLRSFDDANFQVNEFVQNVKFVTSPCTSSERKNKTPKGFVSLFDGESLDGWQGATNGYRVEDGKLVSKEKGGGCLLTDGEYADFIFRFEYKLEPGGNNGVAIRTPKDRTPPTDGMEIQILDDSSPKYKNIRDYQYNGSLYRRIAAKRGHMKPVGQWNREEIMCKGSRLKITLNGTVILDADLEPFGTKAIDGSPHPGLQRKKGYIGFLGHNDRVEFRNIRIKEL